MSNGWTSKPLGQIVTLQRGFDLPKRLRVDGEVPIISSSGPEDWHNEPIKIGPGLVTGRYGTIGKVFFVDGPYWPLNTTLFVSNFHGNDPRFCYYLLQRFDFAGQSGKTGVPGVNRNDLHAIEVFSPDNLPEQQAIAAALSDADGVVAGLERVIAKKRLIKQGAMQDLLTARRRLPGFSGEWEVKRLGDHVRFLKNGTHSRAQLYEHGPVKNLHYGDIHGAASIFLSPATKPMPTLDLLSAGRLDRLAAGDLVFVDASEDLAGVGTSVEITDLGSTEVVSGLHTIAARFDKSVLVDAFKAFLQFMPAFRSHLCQLAAGTKVLATNRRHISSAEIALPRPDEQQAIAKVLSDMDSEIQTLESRLAKARAVKEGMMQNLLTGRVRLV